MVAKMKKTKPKRTNWKQRWFESNLEVMRLRDLRDKQDIEEIYLRRELARMRNESCPECLAAQAAALELRSLAIMLANEVIEGTEPHHKRETAFKLLRAVKGEREVMEMDKATSRLPQELLPKTRELVADFTQALAHKLLAAQKKYGYCSDGWANRGWMDECRAQLREHLEKGDPLDVAAYCAFLWYHKESTAERMRASRETKEQR